MDQLKHITSEVVKKSVDVTSQVVGILRKPTPSVFGAAPSLSQMQAMNKMNQGKKILFRGAYFWYHFRVYYPYICPIVLLVSMIVSLTAWNTIEGHLVMGSILSLIGGLSVIGSYVMIVPWQKHPSVLVVYRTLTNMVFSLVIIFEAISTNKSSCRNFAVATHYILLASESWLTTIASDLVHSLTNPFASYKANLKRYHVLVWGFSSIISFIFYWDRGCQGHLDQGICWVRVTSVNSPCLWGYYLFWIVLMYSYQLWAFLFAYLRLKRGLSVTFEVRKKCAEETFKCLASYAVYLSAICLAFFILSSNSNPKPGTDMANFALFFLFLIANRGTVDSIIWFMLHDFMRDPPISAIDQDHVDPEAGGNTKQKKRISTDILHLPPVNLNQVDIKENLTKAVTELADLAIADFDESDLSPQVNMALRQQIVQYVTKGVRDSILQKELNYSKHHANGIDSYMERIMNPRTKDPAITPGLNVLKFYIDGEHTFKAFGVDIFQEIRFREGITNEKYLESLAKPANERLSEGASGAFMFFCGGGEYIVKTIRAREAKVLHQSLDTYNKYLKEYKTSFLCRFVGSYSLRMYDQTFYFVVMMNCFDPSAKINERYDIKGSWVGRSAEPPSSKQTKRTVCRHCNTYFVPAQQQQCSVIVGPHEPNIVLKDNDLRTRINLDPKQSQEVVTILKRDSELLGKLGVLDYSLLAGVKKFKFNVHVPDEEIGLDSTTNQKMIYATSTFKATAVNGPAVYYLGIVDFLQDWTTKKKLERLFKIYFGRKDPDGLSVMEPLQYMSRFQGKMEQIFDIEGTQAAESKLTTTSINTKAIGMNVQTSARVVRNNYAYDVISDDAANPMVTSMSPERSFLSDSYDSPPPRKNLSGYQSGSHGYGDISGVSNDNLPMGVYPLKGDPYQYVYDNLAVDSSTPASPSLTSTIAPKAASSITQRDKSIVKPTAPVEEEYNDLEDL